MPMESTGFGAALVPLHLPELTAADQALVTGGLKAAERRNCQPSTRKGYGGALKAFVQSWEGHRPASLLQVERAPSEHFLEHREGRGLNPRTLKTLLGCVQRFSGPLIRAEPVAVAPVRAQPYLQEPAPLPRAQR